MYGSYARSFLKSCLCVKVHVFEKRQFFHSEKCFDYEVINKAFENDKCNMSHNFYDLLKAVG